MSSWSREQIRCLRTVLVDLFPDSQKAKVLAHDAGADVGSVAWTGEAVVFWFSALEELRKRNLLDRLLREALGCYPHSDELKDLHQEVGDRSSTRPGSARAPARRPAPVPAPGSPVPPACRVAVVAVTAELGPAQARACRRASDFPGVHAVALDAESEAVGDWMGAFDLVVTLVGARTGGGDALDGACRIAGANHVLRTTALDLGAVSHPQEFPAAFALREQYPGARNFADADGAGEVAAECVQEWLRAHQPARPGGGPLLLPWGAAWLKTCAARAMIANPPRHDTQRDVGSPGRLPGGSGRGAVPRWPGLRLAFLAFLALAAGACGPDGDSAGSAIDPQPGESPIPGDPSGATATGEAAPQAPGLPGDWLRPPLAGDPPPEERAAALGLARMYGLGDVDGDLEHTAADVRLVEDLASGRIRSAPCVRAADVDFSGSVDFADLAFVEAIAGVNQLPLALSGHLDCRAGAPIAAWEVARPGEAIPVVLLDGLAEDPDLRVAVVWGDLALVPPVHPYADFSVQVLPLRDREPRGGRVVIGNDERIFLLDIAVANGTARTADEALGGGGPGGGGSGPGGGPVLPVPPQPDPPSPPEEPERWKQGDSGEKLPRGGTECPAKGKCEALLVMLIVPGVDSEHWANLKRKAMDSLQAMLESSLDCHIHRFDAPKDLRARPHQVTIVWDSGDWSVDLGIWLYRELGIDPTGSVGPAVEAVENFAEARLAVLQDAWDIEMDSMQSDLYWASIDYWSDVTKKLPRHAVEHYDAHGSLGDPGLDPLSFRRYGVLATKLGGPEILRAVQLGGSYAAAAGRVCAHTVVDQSCYSGNSAVLGSVLNNADGALPPDPKSTEHVQPATNPCEHAAWGSDAWLATSSPTEVSLMSTVMTDGLIHWAQLGGDGVPVPLDGTGTPIPPAPDTRYVDEGFRTCPP